MIAIQRACRLFDLPVSNYYYVSLVRPEDEDIKQRMVKIFEESLHSYGKRRLVIDLRKALFKIGVFKTARLMKTLGLVAKRPKKPHYYKMGEEQPTTPHLLQRAFNPTDINIR
ncbi:IS3 family transposase [Marinomonas sp. RSW2]|uniref:IS3 family transposase n=1 Tax=Marinomonas maritima TaxID=2940935 RepID=A0ABT5WJ11_9GAMM|nr:IS3 family transposase [Marinomonas maritima]MDE8604409.1 IS3 family transposase [Marinomonas maritima]